MCSEALLTVHQRRLQFEEALRSDIEGVFVTLVCAHLYFT